MEALIFNNSLSILVNGSPTKDFAVSRDLQQGDPLSLFLFLLVAEGLAAMMSKTPNMGEFDGFRVNDNVHFEILQFVDDTMLIGDESWRNLWSIKAILRGFELVLGLHINLSKSRLVGINLNSDFIQAASLFLNFEIGSPSFTFLGIPVGVNPRRKEVWNLILSKRRSRLFIWKNRNLSIQGIVVLLSIILSNIPIYYFSSTKLRKLSL